MRKRLVDDAKMLLIARWTPNLQKSLFPEARCCNTCVLWNGTCRPINPNAGTFVGCSTHFHHFFAFLLQRYAVVVCARFLSRDFPPEIHDKTYILGAENIGLRPLGAHFPSPPPPWAPEFASLLCLGGGGGGRRGRPCGGGGQYPNIHTSK